MRKESKKREYLPEEIILRVILNDEKAIEQAVSHFDWFIDYILRQLMKENNLNEQLTPKEDMMQEIRMELFRALKKFNMDQK